MSLIEIYVLGVVVEALYMLVKRLTWSKEKVSRFRSELAEQDRRNSINSAQWVPVAIVLMCLLWPYSWIDRLFLKAKGPGA